MFAFDSLHNPCGVVQMSEPNGKWQFAFWMVTGFFVLGLMTITQAVIANDRLREQGDSKLSEKIECLLKDNMIAHNAIIGDLREIKARMGIKEG